MLESSATVISSTPWFLAVLVPPAVGWDTSKKLFVVLVAWEVGSNGFHLVHQFLGPLREGSSKQGRGSINKVFILLS